MKRKRIKHRSDKKKLRDKIGALLLKILIKERGDLCEICRCLSNSLGKFHILPVGEYSKLEFHSFNILLVGWTCCHDNWHSNYFKAREIEKRIRELRGEDYELKLRAINEFQEKHTMIYLGLLYRAFEKRLEDLCE